MLVENSGVFGFSLFFFISIQYSVRKRKGLKALANNLLPNKGNLFFDPLQTICAVRGNLKGNDIQSVVELNA